MEENLNDVERERYRRQLLHEGFTIDHQERLKNSTALVAGIGGLGGAAAIYLAAAGVGRLVLAHYGNLTLSNMNRQVLMRHDAVGSPRVGIAAARIREVNPDVEVSVFDERTTQQNAGGLLEGAAIALSARPNFDERKALNRACVQRGVPMVEAAMNGTEGYLFNVIPGITPCLECVYPEANPEWEELGFPVFGAVSGMLGSLMAMEAIKILTGYAGPLVSKMLLFNMAGVDFRKLSLRRDKECPACGTVA